MTQNSYIFYVKFYTIGGGGRREEILLYHYTPFTRGSSGTDRTIRKEIVEDNGIGVGAVNGDGECRNDGQVFLDKLSWMP